MATYAIGDVQGCMASLERLLALIDFSPARDRLWLVGDLVNRGPRSLDVLRWAHAHDAQLTCVLGNHDLHLLARAAGVAGAKRRDTLDDVLAAPHFRDRLLDWLRHRPLVHVEGEHAMVHAGLHPAWTIEAARALGRELERALRGPHWRDAVSTPSGPAGPPRWDAGLDGADRRRAALSYLVQVRTCRPDGSVEPHFNGAPADAPPGCVPWFALPAPAWRTHTIVFGHWAALGLAVGPHHLGLDTGCVWGNALTACRLEDRRVFQVKAAEAAS